MFVRLPAIPAPIRPAAGQRCNARHTSHATGPIKSRGNTASAGLVNHTSVGPEGAIAACNMLNKPKIRPTAAPTTGPSNTAPMMTGTCMIVSEAPLNQGMKPQCVQPRKAAIAPRTPAITTFRVRDSCI